jgi:putative transposase
MKKIVNRSYKFRLMPTAEQALVLMNWADAKRFVWNKAMGLAETRLMNGHYVPYYEEYNKMLTLWKCADEWKFLKEPPKDVLQYTLKDFRKAIDDWFDPTQKNKRKPHFKSKKDNYRSFRIPGSLVKVDGTNKIIVPKMKEPIFFKRHKRVAGKVKNITISFDGKKWFVSFSCEIEIELAKSLTAPEALDVGTVRFATKTDGTFIPSPSRKPSRSGLGGMLLLSALAIH